ELAQSESYNDQPFARYWMHNGLMKTGDKKMSKSEGNEIVVSQLLEPTGRHEAETLRYLLLSTHYRSPIEYSEERLDQVRRGLESFYRFFERFQRITSGSFHDFQAPDNRAESGLHGPMESGGKDRVAWLCRNYGRSFLEHMDDDFNT